MTTEIIIPMVPANKSSASYGVTYKSEFVYRAQGIVNRAFPHRFVVWDNTIRPNTDPSRVSLSTGLPIGPGRYVSPNLRGTDDAITVLLDAESIGVDSYGTGTGTRGSGQVWAPEEFVMGNVVRLSYPDGTVSGPYIIRERALLPLV